MKRIFIIMAAWILILLVIGRFNYPNKGSASVSHSLNLAPTYTLSMRAEAGAEFDYGKSRKYYLQSDDKEIILTCNESGGIFQKNLNAKIRFNPQTLRGTWDYNLGGVVQGGEILLDQSPHGFVFKTTHTIGPYAGSPPSYGTLIANP